MMRYVLTLLLITLTMPVQAELPQHVTKKIIAMAKEGAWSGKAMGPDGLMVEPPVGKDKSIAYIPDSEAEQVLKIGTFSGAAEACGVDWKPYFGRFMDYQRGLGRSEYQMAYVGILHGIGQELSHSALKGECTPQQKSNIQKTLEQ